ncbi:hypothetical protein TNCV_5012001 [Trichonephila clavipes]|nr:hypothetical protein TNCV_5012001 [Trichonephila clavipes]
MYYFAKDMFTEEISSLHPSSHRKVRYHSSIYRHLLNSESPSSDDEMGFKDRAFLRGWMWDADDDLHSPHLDPFVKNLETEENLIIITVYVVL